MHRLTFAILFLALAALPLRAGAVEHKFRLSISGLSVANVVLNIESDGAAYTATGLVRGRGLVGALVNLDYDGISKGDIVGGSPRPTLFRGQQYDSRSEGRVTTVRYQNGAPVSVVADPPYDMRDWALDPTRQGGTMDPIAAAAAVFDDRPVGAACDRTIEIYDGRHRSRIILRAPSRTENGWVCAGVYRRVSGYPPVRMKEQVDFPFSITYEEQKGYMRVMRVDMESTFGTGRLVRR